MGVDSGINVEVEEIFGVVSILSDVGKYVATSNDVFSWDTDDIKILWVLADKNTDDNFNDVPEGTVDIFSSTNKVDVGCVVNLFVVWLDCMIVNGYFVVFFWYFEEIIIVLPFWVEDT